MNTPLKSLEVSDELRAAKVQGLPIVGLETSGITSGTYPHNLEIALAVDASARDEGAVPARVAVIDGQLKIGLNRAELEQLARTEPGVKLSNRDLAVAIAQGLTGGTTVSASLLIAEKAGLAVFAVAGIGGVHRGAEKSFDISADLAQFASSPLAVVCAGAKSLLDPALTIEYLETAGIPVIGYQSDYFPGYYTESTGVKVPHRLDDLADVVRAMHAHWNYVSRSAVLVTHPIAAEWSIDAAELDRLVDEALLAAASSGASGAGLTPFVLSAISHATAGRSVKVNDEVLLSTTRLGAQLACEVARQTVDNALVGSTP